MRPGTACQGAKQQRASCGRLEVAPRESAGIRSRRESDRGPSGASPGASVLWRECESAPRDPCLGTPAKHLCKGTSRRPQGWLRSLSHGKDAAGCAGGKTHIPEAHTMKARVPVHGVSPVASQGQAATCFQRNATRNTWTDGRKQQKGCGPHSLRIVRLSNTFARRLAYRFTFILNKIKFYEDNEESGASCS